MSLADNWATVVVVVVVVVGFLLREAKIVCGRFSSLMAVIVSHIY